MLFSKEMKKQKKQMPPIRNRNRNRYRYRNRIRTRTRISRVCLSGSRQLIHGRSYVYELHYKALKIIETIINPGKPE
jgi:hypothetical protein